MNKSIWLNLGILFFGSVSYASQPECIATKIYDSSVLEESFSVDEYPGVGWSQEDVYIGSSRFSTDNGDQIVVVITFDFKKMVEVTTSVGPQFYIYYTDRPILREHGELKYRANKGEDYRLLADLDCR
ncbi:hypothetical protein KDA08_05950 [Candidatus Saccharibacteria bacterium]|nr:hypothetical protein [Candidatus Saccharibacteria bacterium]